MREFNCFVFLVAASLLAACQSENFEKSANRTSDLKDELPSGRRQLRPAFFLNSNTSVSEEIYSKALYGDNSAQYQVASACQFIEPPSEQLSRMSTEQKKSFYAEVNKVAFDFFAKAASGGNYAAQKDLAMCYQIGRGTAQNYQLAYKWFRVALLDAKRRKNSDDINDTNDAIQALKDDVSAKAQALREDQSKDAALNAALSQFTDAFRMRDLIGSEVTLDIPAGNFRRLWAARSTAACFHFYVAYVDNDTVAMQKLVDSGEVFLPQAGTKATVVSYDKGMQQVRLRFSEGTGHKEIFVVPYHFIKPE